MNKILNKISDGKNNDLFHQIKKNRKKIELGVIYSLKAKGAKVRSRIKRVEEGRDSQIENHERYTKRLKEKKMSMIGKITIIKALVIQNASLINLSNEDISQFKTIFFEGRVVMRKLDAQC